MSPKANAPSAIAKELTRRSFKVSKYNAKTKVAKRLDNLDEQAEMETFLNLRVPKWLKAHHPATAWISIHAEEFEGAETMGDFASLIEKHLTDTP